MVTGNSCSGKTTFSGRLSRCPGITCVELDGLFWLADWQQRETEDFRALVRREIACEQWTVDGNYVTVRDQVWPRAMHIIILSGVSWNVPSNVLSGVPIPVTKCMHGNVESFRKSFFSRDSILWWAIRSHRPCRDEYSELMRNGLYPQLEFIELKSQREAERFLGITDIASRTLTEFLMEAPERRLAFVSVLQVLVDNAASHTDA